MNDIGFLFAGYGVIWVILGGYFITIARRQSSLRRELQQLERAVERDA